MLWFKTYRSQMEENLELQDSVGLVFVLIDRELAQSAILDQDL